MATRCNVNPAINFTDLVYGQQPSTHEAFTQCYFNVSPMSFSGGKASQRVSGTLIRPSSRHDVSCVGWELTVPVTTTLTHNLGIQKVDP